MVLASSGIALAATKDASQYDSEEEREQVAAVIRFESRLGAGVARPRRPARTAVARARCEPRNRDQGTPLSSGDGGR